MGLMLFLIGLCVGSFLGALSYRYPRDISVISGRSWCDKCRSEIKWYDNIPVISFLILRGGCRQCGKKISPRYPIIEIVTAIGFVLVGSNILNLFLLCILVLIFVADFEHQIIPDVFVMSGIFGATLLLFIKNSSLLFSNYLAGFLAAMFLMSIALFTKGKGMGLGDVKFAVLGGLIVGLENVIVWLFSAFVLGAVVGIVLIIIGDAKLKDKIAFGPFLVAAIPIALLWGDRLRALVI